MRKFSGFLLFFLLMFVPFTSAQPLSAQPLPPLATEEANHEILVNIPGLMPEGIEYDAERERFLLSSLSTGTITEIGLLGAAKPFIEDDDLISSVGIHIDVANDRLLVTNSDSSVFSNPSATGTAGLAAYDLESGERLFYADLAALTPDGSHFANDVTVDVDGNAYVTNSFQPVIYKVDLEGNAEVLIEDDQLTSEIFGLNGIDYHPDGYLLAAVVGDGALFKIPLDDPKALSQVELSEATGIDGMVITEDGTVIAVAQIDGAKELVEIASNDDWETAEIISRVPISASATTVALAENVPHYINAYLNNPRQERYEIVAVSLPDPQ